MHVVIIVFACLTACGESLKILGVFPLVSYSHYILGLRLMEGLAKRGHDITFIAPYKEKHETPNITTVFLEGFQEEMEKIMTDINMFDLEDTSPFIEAFVLHMYSYEGNEKTLNHTNVQKLLKTEINFDIVIMEHCLTDALTAFCYHFKSKCVRFSAISSTYFTNWLVGNPTNPAYIPEMLTRKAPPLNFFDRMYNTIIYGFGKMLHQLYWLPVHDKLMHKYFPGYPTIYELCQETDLFLLNAHPTTTQAIPRVPSMIEIGGFHVQPPEKLPEHLKTYMDKSKRGVIIFSMGSILKSKNLPDERRNEILRAFSKLNMNVIWKFEDVDLPNKPKNVLIQKWLPQQDILAHPNIKLFISHGGLLSTTEAVYHGVPVIGIPIFADQKLNVLQAESAGFAIPLFYQNLTESSLTWALNEMITNKKYTIKAKELSNAFHDRPLKPMDTATFWIEYVARHNGTKHFRSAALDLNWYEYYLLDVGAVLLLVSGICLFSFCSFLKFSRNVLTRTKCEIIKTKEN